MCGISGVFSVAASGLPRNRADVLRDLAIANSVRGTDATGAFYLKLNGPKKEDSIWHVKDAVSGPVFIADQASWRSDVEGTRFVVLHNRSATSGSMARDAAHPFLCENVIGVHNGTLGSPFAGSKLTEDSDSLLLYKAMAEASHDPAAVTKLLSSISMGSYALVWYDFRSASLRMARNDERPLFFMQASGHLWFGSELGMLEWIISRHSMGIQKSWALKPHVLVDIPVAGGPATLTPYTPKTVGRVSYFSGYATEGKELFSSRASADVSVSRTHLMFTRSKPPSFVASARVGDMICEKLCAFLNVDKFIGDPPNISILPLMNKFVRDNLHDSVVDDDSSLSPLVTVEVEGVEDGRLLAFVLDKNGDKAPVSLAYALTHRIARAVHEFLSTGRTAKVSNLSISGVVVSHDGGVALYAEAPMTYATDIKVTCGKLISKRQKGYVKQCHPNYTAYVSQPDWEAGWRSQS